MSSSTAAARVAPRPVARPVGRTRPQQPRLRVVAPVRHRAGAGLALLCVILLGGGLMALLLLNISIGKGAYELSELQSRQRLLTVQQQALAEQVDAVSAPAQLAAAASKLGMVEAPNTAFLRLPDGRIEGELEAAKVAPKPVVSAAKPAAGATAKPGPKTTTKAATTKAATTKAATTKAATTKGKTPTTAATAPAKAAGATSTTTKKPPKKTGTATSTVTEPGR